MAEEEDTGTGIHLLGRRLGKITCYRESLMSGIGGGLATGVAFFLFTSNIKRATNLGFAGFVGITVVSWGICRTLSAPPMDEKELRNAIQKKILIEGTDLEKQMKIESQTKDV